MSHSFRKIAAIAATIATAILPFANVTPAYAAAPNWNTTGSYTLDFELSGSHYVHDLSLVQTGASLAGNGGYPAGGPHSHTWVLTSGSVDGDTIDFTVDYTAPADTVTPQTTMHVIGTIAAGTMSGTWSDNYQGSPRSGTWVSATGTAAPMTQTVCSTLTLSSDSGTTYKGMTTADPAGSADGSFTGGSAPAVVAGPDGYPGAWDTAGNDSALTGASWVNDTSVAPTNVNGGQADAWRLFGESFALPLNATVSSATVSFSADNSANAYFNDAAIGSVADFATVTTVPFAATPGSNEIEFVTKNFAFDGATNPTAIIYKATINYCVPVVVTPPPAVCPANTTATLVETDVVNSNSVAPTMSTNALLNGDTYLLKASGTWVNTPYNVSDAEFTSTDLWATHADGYDITPYMLGEGEFDLQVNGGFVNWGPYSATHEYSYLTTGAGVAASFGIFDGDSNVPTVHPEWYGDNVGTLSVAIYHCVPPAPVTGSLTINKITIGGDGTFTFTGAGTGSTAITTVGGAGSKTITGLTPGNYSITEAAQSGWSQTSNTCANVPVVAGQTATCTITNTALSTISGQKYNDLNRNGRKDSGEPGLQGWVIRLILDNPTTHKDTLIATTTTDASGNYSFTNVVPGTYDVRETHQKGWKRQSKNPKDIVITDGSTVVGIDFGNAVTKKGEKEDTDNDDNHHDQDGKYFCNQGRSDYSKEKDNDNHSHQTFAGWNRGKNH